MAQEWAGDPSSFDETQSCWKTGSRLKGIPARVLCLMTGFKNHVRGDIHRWVMNAYHALSFKRTWETDKGFKYPREERRDIVHTGNHRRNIGNSLIDTSLN